MISSCQSCSAIFLSWAGGLVPRPMLQTSTWSQIHKRMISAKVPGQRCSKCSMGAAAKHHLLYGLIRRAHITTYYIRRSLRGLDHVKRLSCHWGVGTRNRLASRQLSLSISVPYAGADVKRGTLGIWPSRKHEFAEGAPGPLLVKEGRWSFIHF
jgi:hypothetical protein